MKTSHFPKYFKLKLIKGYYLYLIHVKKYKYYFLLHTQADLSKVALNLQENEDASDFNSSHCTASGN